MDLTTSQAAFITNKGKKPADTLRFYVVETNCGPVRRNRPHFTVIPEGEFTINPQQESTSRG